jgi:galactoside 2-L-fucosyltransferase 1/2
MYKILSSINLFLLVFLVSLLTFRRLQAPTPLRGIPDVKLFAGKPYTPRLSIRKSKLPARVVTLQNTSDGHTKSIKMKCLQLFGKTPRYISRRIPALASGSMDTTSCVVILFNTSLKRQQELISAKDSCEIYNFQNGDFDKNILQKTIKPICNMINHGSRKKNACIGQQRAVDILYFDYVISVDHLKLIFRSLQALRMPLTKIVYRYSEYSPIDVCKIEGILRPRFAPYSRNNNVVMWKSKATTVGSKIEGILDYPCVCGFTCHKCRKGLSASKNVARLPSRFVKWQPLGYLGNHMFQFASSLGIAKTLNATLCGPSSQYLSEAFNMPYISPCPTSEVFEKVVERGYAIHDKRFFVAKSKNFIPRSYLQSWKYFWDIRQLIHEIFTFRENIIKLGENFKKKNAINENCVGIHIRLGDHSKHGYLKLPSILQFKKAMELVQVGNPKLTFIVASDDANWVKNQPIFRSGNIKVSTESAAVDMYLLSSCTKVIVSRGTFGWWAGFLARKFYFYDEHDMEHRNNKNKVKKTDYYPPIAVEVI